jgi:hypothetical protein
VPEVAATAYTAVPKTGTVYAANPLVAANGVTLGSLSVTLDSLSVHLHGYESTDPPTAAGSPPTAYAQIAKQPTPYS